MPEAGVGCVPSAGQADLPGPEKASRSLDALLTQIPCPAAYSTTCLLSYCGARLWLTCGSSARNEESAAYSTTCLLSYCGATLWLTCGSSTRNEESAAYSTTCLLSYCGAVLWLTCGSSTCSDEPEGKVLCAEIIKWYILVTDCAVVRMHAGKRQRQPPSVPLSPQRASPYSVHRSIFLDFPYLRFGWLILLIPVP